MVAKHSHTVTYADLNRKFSAAVHKTLGEIDDRGRFASLANKPKMTGVAGLIVEESIVGYDADNKQRPDLIVDGQEVELKTTGVRLNKHKDAGPYEAKEPMSITAVSPDVIVHEKFEDSHFWHKIAHLLFVYYLYDSDKTVISTDYANFPVLGYEFFQFSDDEKKVLQNDWTIVRNFLRKIQAEYDDPREGYPRLSSELRKQLMFIDTAPKWPHQPRFRLKRAVVNSIVDRYFATRGAELDEAISSFSQFDKILHHYVEMYAGKTVRDLLSDLDVVWQPNKRGDVDKSVAERLVIHMFGSRVSKFRDVEIFKEMGLLPKSIVLSNKGGRTEDFKISGLDLPSWTQESDDFDESILKSFFSETQLLMIMFEEPSTDAKLLDNKFLGFKRYSFDEAFIQKYVKKLWMHTRDLINNDRLVDVKGFYKDGKPKINKKTGLQQSAPNFLKSSDNPVFVRGTGNDSSKKPVEINGISMYIQDIWVKGSVMVKLLSTVGFV